jgi:5-methyltetrahydropteroyltriglutamate--homocysteine methyltransferase
MCYRKLFIINGTHVEIFKNEMMDFPLFDDVGSFPLPQNIEKETFNKFYWIAYKAYVNNIDINENRGIFTYYIAPLIEAFKNKLNAGVEIINYPQLMDMHNQFLKPITDFEVEPGLIEKSKATISEVKIVSDFAKQYYELNGVPVKLKLCVTGPIELYVKKHKFTVYYDLALNYAKSINTFLKNSVLNTKFMQTSVISLDEPSFGYVDLLNISDEEIIRIFNKTLEGVKMEDKDIQLHIHTLNRADIALKSKYINVVTCEYASNKLNKIPKKVLEEYDKYIRVGICRTNIDNIIAEYLDKGVKLEYLQTEQGMSSLIDSEEIIERNLLDALELYGSRLKYVGPDCGLGGWPSQKTAFNLLSRIKSVIHKVKQAV